MIEIAKISRHSRSRESRDQDRDFDTALEVDGDLDEKEKTPTLKNDRSHDKKSRGILGLLHMFCYISTIFISTIDSRDEITHKHISDSQIQIQALLL